MYFRDSPLKTKGTLGCTLTVLSCGTGNQVSWSGTRLLMLGTLWPITESRRLQTFPIVQV